MQRTRAHHVRELQFIGSDTAVAELEVPAVTAPRLPLSGDRIGSLGGRQLAVPAERPRTPERSRDWDKPRWHKMTDVKDTPPRPPEGKNGALYAAPGEPRSFPTEPPPIL